MGLELRRLRVAMAADALFELNSWIASKKRSTTAELGKLAALSVLPKIIHDSQAAWRAVIIAATQLGVPTPAFSAALGYYDSYRRERLPTNLLQAQRDYFRCSRLSAHRPRWRVP
ncbi:MAG: hypothetical protein U0930_14710 [Pirellulales bacterium]